MQALLFQGHAFPEDFFLPENGLLWTDRWKSPSHPERDCDKNRPFCAPFRFASFPAPAYSPDVEKREALAATLGTEPQVVLLAFRLLLRQGATLEKCLVFHTSSQNPAIRAAITKLSHAWPRWASVPLEWKTLPVEDLDSSEALRRAFRAVREGLQGLKAEGFHVHLCVAGGRKPIALAALLTAQFLFGPQDRLWYLYTPPGREKEEPRKLVHDPRVRLVELPVPIWTEISFFLEAVARYEDPWVAAEAQRALVRRLESQRWLAFFQERLTPAEQEVVRTLVEEGGTNKDLARKLGKSPRTVGHQLAAIYRKLRQELGDNVRVDRTAVVGLFSPVLRFLGQKTDAPRCRFGESFKEGR